MEELCDNLGRDESKHIKCNYEKQKDLCPDRCTHCAIAMKTDGDAAIAAGNTDQAIRQYKKAVFAEPHYAEAWMRLGNAFGMRLEHHNALTAFDKALNIDPTYGEAMFGKAMSLNAVGQPDAAMVVANEILECYQSARVLRFKEGLIKNGTRDTANVFSLEKAIDVMTDYAYVQLRQYDLLDAQGKVSTEHAIYEKESFAESIYNFCQKQYASFGKKKIYSETCLSAFYASICATLLYYKNPDGFDGISAFSYVADHINIEEAESAAERLLLFRGDDIACENLWNIIYPFVQFAIETIDRVEPLSDTVKAVLDAAESAYMIGMLYAMRWNEKQASKQQRDKLDVALKKLAETSSDYEYTPSDIRCYSISAPDKISLMFTCECCGNQSQIMVWEDSMEIFNQYHNLANEFSELGYKAAVICCCDQCADMHYPSASKYRKNNIVFTVQMPGCSNPVHSFPATHAFCPADYRVALAFLRGANTISALAEQTGTDWSADAYLACIQKILGIRINQVEPKE